MKLLNDKADDVYLSHSVNLFVFPLFIFWLKKQLYLIQATNVLAIHNKKRTTMGINNSRNCSKRLRVLPTPNFCAIAGAFPEETTAYEVSQI